MVKLTSYVIPIDFSNDVNGIFVNGNIKRRTKTMITLIKGLQAGWMTESFVKPMGSRLNDIDRRISDNTLRKATFYVVRNHEK